MTSSERMLSPESTFKKSELTLMAILAVIAMAMISIAVIPSLRTNIKDFFTFSGRIVIAKVSGNLGAQGPQVTILKIQNKGTLGLEIFTDTPEGQILMTKIPMTDVRDGYFLHQGNATNLAITDIDKDGNVEIVAPTYDDQMIPRLNIFRYNPLTKSVERVNAP